jgi:hypothetical protein
MRSIEDILALARAGPQAGVAHGQVRVTFVGF